MTERESLLARWNQFLAVGGFFNPGMPKETT